MEKGREGHILYRGARPFNFRPLLFLAAAFGVGIFLAYRFGVLSLWAAPVLAVAAATLPFLFRAGRRAVSGVLLFALALGIACAVGSLSFGMRTADFERSPAVAGEAVVTGVLEEVGRTEKTTSLTFGEVVFYTPEGEAIASEGRLRAYVYGDADLPLGARVTFAGEISTYDALSYGRVNASYIVEGVRYTAFLSRGDLTVLSEGSPGLFGAVNEYLRDLLFEHMDTENAALAFALLTGNSGWMDGDVLQNFRYGGVAHIFAVSGMNFAIVYAALLFVCKRLRVRARFYVPAIAALLIFYAGVCGFAPSAVRALVMCIVLMLMDAGGFAYDRVSSVSAAFLVVLIVHPHYLFSVGFSLSVAAAAGIIVLGGPIARLFTRLRLPRSASSAPGVALSAQIAVFPILIDSFGYTSGIGLALNLLFVPLVSAAYGVLFVFALLACLLPFAAGVILFLPEYVLRLCIFPVLALDFRFWLIGGFAFGACALLWYLLCLFLSGKVNLRPLPRAAACLLLSGALAAGMIFTNVPVGYEATFLLTADYGGSALVVRHEGGVGLIASGRPDGDFLEQLCLREGIDRFSEVIFLAPAFEVNASLPTLLQYAEADVLYVAEEAEFPASLFRTVEVRSEPAFFSFGGGEAIFLNEETLYWDFGGAGVLISMGELPERLPRCDLFIAQEPGGADALSPAQEAYFGPAAGKPSVYSSGDLQIGRKNGIISIKGRA